MKELPRRLPGPQWQSAIRIIFVAWVLNKFGISGIGVYYPDGTETQRKGVRIDKVIYPTLAVITAGRDELLEEAIRIIREKNR